MMCKYDGDGIYAGSNLTLNGPGKIIAKGGNSGVRLASTATTTFSVNTDLTAQSTGTVADNAAITTATTGTLTISGSGSITASSTAGHGIYSSSCTALTYSLTNASTFTGGGSGHGFFMPANITRSTSNLTFTGGTSGRGANLTVVSTNRTFTSNGTGSLNFIGATGIYFIDTNVNAGSFALAGTGSLTVNGSSVGITVFAPSARATLNINNLSSITSGSFGIQMSSSQGNTLTVNRATETIISGTTRGLSFSAGSNTINNNGTGTLTIEGGENGYGYYQDSGNFTFGNTGTETNPGAIVIKGGINGINIANTAGSSMTITVNHPDVRAESTVSNAENAGIGFPTNHTNVNISGTGKFTVKGTGQGNGIRFTGTNSGITFNAGSSISFIAESGATGKAISLTGTGRVNFNSGEHQLTVVNKNAGSEIVPCTKTGALQWNVIGGTLTGFPTDANVSVSVPAGGTATIKLE